jgi:SAM-dependent MidA family methyltransferase
MEQQNSVPTPHGLAPFTASFPSSFPATVSPALHTHIAHAIADAGGWLPFDRFMALALYTPGLGYYAQGRVTFGLMPGERVTGGGDARAGSDFVTAPELSPLFGQTLARQVAQALTATGTRQVWEFGAGSGALALQLLKHLMPLNQAVDAILIDDYNIVDVSGVLRQRQQHTLAAWGDKVRWHDELPAAMQGVVLGNEVLDAMPVTLLARVGGVWQERGVGLADTTAAPNDLPRFMWQDRATELRPPIDIPGDHDYLTEIHPQAEGFIATLAERLGRGAAFFIDYGFPEHEYYHPQRSTGTLVCHHLHRMDSDPLSAVGDKDITAHVNFTGVALAGQDAGWQVLGYTSQGRFLINGGLIDALNALPDDARGLAQRSMAAKLIHEHEMGELFKVIALAPAGCADWLPMGFSSGDRTHRL